MESIKFQVVQVAKSTWSIAAKIILPCQHPSPSLFFMFWFLTSLSVITSPFPPLIYYSLLFYASPLPHLYFLLASIQFFSVLLPLLFWLTNPSLNIHSSVLFLPFSFFSFFLFLNTFVLYFLFLYLVPFHLILYCIRLSPPFPLLSPLSLPFYVFLAPYHSIS